MITDKLAQLQKVLDDIDSLADDTDRQMPYFAFFVTDFLFATRAWSREERCCYLELLCFEWLQGQLSSDPAQLAALLGMKAEKFARYWEGRLGSKFMLCPARNAHFNLRLEKERRKTLKRGKRNPVSNKKPEADGLTEAQRAEVSALAASSEPGSKPF